MSFPGTLKPHKFQKVARGWHSLQCFKSIRHLHTLIYPTMRNSQSQELTVLSKVFSTILVHLNLSNTGLVACYRGYCSGTHYNASSQQHTYTPRSIMELEILRLRSLLCLSKSSAQYHTSSLKPLQYRTFSWRG